MAAKPPKPPGNFLNQNNNSKKNNNNINNTAITSSATSETNNSGNKSSKNSNNRSSNSNNNSNNSNSTRGEHNVLEENASYATPTSAPRPTCVCTNISIMHLFHEMKQEFPTIPDPIVAQCVNENCHQRENCLQMLRNELALNPIPVQAYPAKVLQQQRQQQQQQQKLQIQHSLEKPPKPLKPIRVAPSPLQAVNSNFNSSFNSNLNPNTSQLYAHLRGGQFPAANPTSPLKQQHKLNFCDSVEVLADNFCNNSNTSSGRSNSCSKAKDVKNSSVAGIGECLTTTPTPMTNTKLSDMPTTTAATTTATQPPTNRVNNHINNSNSVSENPTANSAHNVRNSPPPPTHQPPPPPIAPRARPTTLNIQSQKEIRQQLNVQLQQHFQQQQQRQPTPSSTATTPTTPPYQQQHQQQQLLPQRPLRKAPLPPIAPKPTQFTTSGGGGSANSPVHQYNNQLYHHHNNISAHSQQQPQQQTSSNCFSNNYNNNNNNTYNQNETSSSASSQLTSPSTSVAGESEISVNVSSLLSSPATTPTTTTTTQLQNANNNPQQLKSPSPHIARHRSVINVQPEPPYTRDFLVQSPTSSVASTSGCSSVAGGQKSFTSVNLTLRQPNAALPHQSTIDISAGPGLGSGGGGGAGGGGGPGLTYSSTSYDARRGFQKNFQLTVTDEGGVFSACRIRPRSCVYPGGGAGGGEHEQDGPVGSIAGPAESLPPLSDGVNPVRTATSEQSFVQQQQYPTSPTQAPYYNYIQPSYQQQQQQQQNIVASNTATQYREIMCQPRQSDGTAQIIERQKMRRDKLATALRDNKKRLNRVLQEIDVLKQPVTPGASERLDCEIQRLRCDCQAMLNEIENARRSGPSIITWQDNNKASTPTQQQQPFPANRQRPPRPPPPMSSLSASTSPRQPQLDFVQRHSSTTTPTLTPTLNSPQQFSPHPVPPPTYQQSIVDQQQQQLQPASSSSLLLNDEEDYSEEELEEDVEPSEMWPCNMCTFRNHPQLNICECCENIRILPAPVLSREDIHITLSPGENRIIHSWILS